MDDAIDFNNNGIAFLEAGCHEDALYMFLAAIQVLSQTAEGSTMTSNERVHHVYAKLQTPIQSQRPSAIPEDQDVSFVYQKAMKLESAPQGFDHAVIVLFNAALTYHLRGFSHQSSVMNSSFQSALILYEEAYKILSSTKDINGQTCLLIMAMLNNIGQIHHKLGQYVTSRRFLDELCSFVCHYQVTSGEANELRHDLHSFLLNSMLLQSPTSAVAA